MISVQAQVRALFDLPEQDNRWEILETAPIDDMLPKAGELLFITGPSGSGKSRLLRCIEKTLQDKHVNLISPSQITWDDIPVVDCIDLPTVEERLELLARVGLAEAWNYLQPPSQLSDGQRWRFLLAMMLCKLQRHSGLVILSMDEFASLLDRVTAMVVARQLHKLIKQNATQSAAIICTCHDDLIKALDPDIVVRCDFGTVQIDRRE